VTIVLYPGTFDPITRGHVDIASRAAALFGTVVVGVYDTPNKSLLFDTATRVRLAKGALTHIENVRVIAYQGLTVDFAQECGAVAIVRGLRAYSDFENELQMAHQNRALRPLIETVCLMTSLEYSYLSSTLLREVARLGGDIRSLVPENVELELEARFGAETHHDAIPRHLHS